MTARVTTLSLALTATASLLATPVLAGPPESVVRPQIVAGPLDNPSKGWCPFTDAGEITLPYSMVFFPVAWSWSHRKENLRLTNGKSGCGKSTAPKTNTSYFACTQTCPTKTRRSVVLSQMPHDSPALARLCELYLVCAICRQRPPTHLAEREGLHSLVSTLRP